MDFLRACQEKSKRCLIADSTFQQDTYLLCVSEHEHSEDTFGRLSCGAYSESTGTFRYVMNSGVFFNRSNALKAYASPVAYLSDGNLKRNSEKLFGISRRKNSLDCTAAKRSSTIVLNIR